MGLDWKWNNSNYTQLAFNLLHANVDTWRNFPQEDLGDIIYAKVPTSRKSTHPIELTMP